MSAADETSRSPLDLVGRAVMPFVSALVMVMLGTDDGVEWAFRSLVKFCWMGLAPWLLGAALMVQIPESRFLGWGLAVLAGLPALVMAMVFDGFGV